MSKKIDVAISRPVADKPAIPGFQALSSVGRGASGEVWICKNETDGSVLAVKIVRKSTSSERAWFKRELDALKNYTKIKTKPDSLLDIRHVALSPDKDFLYYMMPAADGVTGINPAARRYKPLTLRHRLSTEGVLQFRECAEIAERTVEALGTLHANSLLHRDVKPDNIIFINGRAVLADMGLVTEDITVVSMVGTPQYLEPGKAPSPQTDLYAAGKVLYQMMNGKDPRDFPEPASRDTDKDSHLFPKLNDICMRACGDDDERYRDANGMLADLRIVLSMPEQPAPSPIDVKYTELGGSGGFLGEPIHEERYCPDGVGRHRTFRNPDGMLSSIHWHPDTGAFETHGGIEAEWGKRNWENSFLGYPVSDENDFTDADYMRDILGKAPAELPAAPRVIGRRSLFQGGCIVWLSDPGIKAQCGEYAFFCRPISGGGWRLVVSEVKSKSFWDCFRDFLPGRVNIPIPETVIERDLEQGYAAKAWAYHQRAKMEKAQAKPRRARNRGAAGKTSDAATAARRAVRPEEQTPPSPFLPHGHPASHLLDGASPVWSLQQGQDAFAWNGCAGRLYKLTEPFTFIKGQTEMNKEAFAKIRVAVFLPPDYRPDTPMVYTLADVGQDIRSNACMVQAVIGCGCGMVALDVPFTGICKFGADMADGTPVNIDSAFDAAVNEVGRRCGAKNMGGAFTYRMQQFTARNLWLTRDFLEREFGVRPRRTVITGAGFGTQNAAYAFNATGFGDVLLGLAGVPELLKNTRYSSADMAEINAVNSLMVTLNMIYPLFGFFDKTLRPIVIESWRWLFNRIPPINDKWEKKLNPSHYADRVLPPREVHLLCGDEDKARTPDSVFDALDSYTELRQNSVRKPLLFGTGNRRYWPDALDRNLDGGKSVTWFDGGADLSDWRNDLRLMFLETKLRMLTEPIL